MNYDYQRVARVIRYLDAHHAAQPDLSALAAQAGLSPFHFHRLFHAWAGVTPKDFLQCLTVTHAKALLRRGASVLDAALDAGLSGAGRLHDLCVTLEAATPGELKARGEGQHIVYGRAASPFGDCLIAATARGVCHLEFVEPDADALVPRALLAQWPAAQYTRDDERAAALLAPVFRQAAQPAGSAPLQAYVTGTAFQLRVWRALLRVPPGTLVTYKAIAAAIGAPRSARAVGNAVGSNPLAFLIPCHRVIRDTGIVGGYRWGATRKRAMLAWESARLPAAAPRP